MLGNEGTGRRFPTHEISFPVASLAQDEVGETVNATLSADEFDVASNSTWLSTDW
jgi:hypothetical protein